MRACVRARVWGGGGGQRERERERGGRGEYKLFNESVSQLTIMHSS